MRLLTLVAAFVLVACGSDSQPPALGGGNPYVGGGGGGGGGGDSGSGSDGGTIGAVVDNLVVDTLVPGGVADFAGPFTGVTNLIAGNPYVLVFTGTYSIWAGGAWQPVCAGTPEAAAMFPSPGETGAVGLDAAWLFAWPTVSPTYCPNGTPVGPPPRSNPVVGVSVDGGSNWASLIPRETTYQTSHTYHFDIVGAGRQVQVRITAGGNYGQFHVAVAKAS